MKKHLAVIVVLFLTCNRLFAQTDNKLFNTNQYNLFSNTTKETFTLSSCFGIFDRFSFGVGYTLDDLDQLELKYSPFNSAASSQGVLGIKYNRLFDSKIIQSISIEAGIFDAFKSEAYNKLDEKN